MSVSLHARHPASEFASHGRSRDSPFASLPLRQVAGPMGYKGSTMAMGDFGPNWARGMRSTTRSRRGMPSAPATRGCARTTSASSREFAEANYTRLVDRWNMPDVAGQRSGSWSAPAAMTGNDFAGPSPSLDAGRAGRLRNDARVRSAAARLYRAAGLNNDYRGRACRLFVLRSRLRRSCSRGCRRGAAHARPVRQGRGHADAAPHRQPLFRRGGRQQHAPVALQFHVHLLKEESP